MKIQFRSLLRATLPACVIASVLATASTPLHAHEDDGKVRDKQKAVKGRVWREGDGSVAGSTFASQGIALKSWHPLNTIDAGATSGNDCWGYVSSSGREYAIMCVSNGTAFYDVTDPVNATKVGFIAGPSSLWRDAKVFGRHVYVVTEGGAGIQVINVANIDSGVVTLANTITTGGGLATHNVAINEQSGYLYRCGGGASGLRIYNLNGTPAAPVFVGEWSTHYVHDAQIVSYTTGPWAGREIAFCCAGLNGGNVETGLYIVDVTNKAAPTLLSRLLYPSARYSHQGWLTEDRRYFLLGDELDEGATQSFSTTHVIDVQFLNNPSYVGQFANATPAITHNCYTHNGKMFQANYRSGLRVFDVSNAGVPSAVTEVAYFDTYPTDDLAQFNGLWSCYPYFPSGTVIGSDLERGLFVMRIETPAATFAVANPPAFVDPAGGTTVDVTVTPLGGQTLDAASGKMFVSAGGTTVERPLVPVGGTTWRASFPASTCTETISYRFEVRSTVGNVSSEVATRSALSAIGQETIRTDTFETAAGWTGGVAGDTATSGIWVRVDPVGTIAQPENDNSAVGTQCWVTGNGVAGGADGAADVDAGFTTLLSPALDLTGLDEPMIEYYFWYSNNLGGAPNADSMPIEISNNGGTTWTLLADVAVSNNAWTRHQWRVRDFVTPTNNVRVRFIARDLATGSLVEAAVDDFRVLNTDCTANTVPGDLNADGLVNGADLAVLLNGWNTTGITDIDGSGNTDAADLAVLLNNWS